MIAPVQDLKYQRADALEAVNKLGRRKPGGKNESLHR
jgi:hypothetical protein